MKSCPFALAVAACLLACTALLPAQSAPPAAGFVDAAAFGFAPEAKGVVNTVALQRAVDAGGTVVVSRPGVYALADTVYLGSHTALIFGAGVALKKVDEQGPFCHVLLNKGALTKTWDTAIAVTGLHVIVNGMDNRLFKVYGLHGQIAFHYVKDLRVERFRCHDLGKAQYGIHICTFEDVVVNDVIIAGDKDGVHLGRGRRFTISNGVFRTYDDAVALNAHDYSVGNPELGWIEDGVVQNCHDLDDGKKPVGFFCRILAGAWIDWREGMEVQQSDTVVSGGRLYRVQAKPDGTVYKSVTRPTHERGSQTLDGIAWGVVQDDVTYTAGVRNVVFRDIFLRKARIGFSVHFDNDKYSRSYYPGAPVPAQERLLFDNIRVLHGQRTPFLSIGTPMDAITIVHSNFGASRIVFHGNKALPDYLRTKLNVVGCVFDQAGAYEFVTNSVPGKEVELQTSASLVLADDFAARVVAGPGRIAVRSDLPGLRP
jgi:polygalacturonase